MVNRDVPFVVCVAADRNLRERVVRQLDDCVVLVCTDLAELRAMIFPTGSEVGPPSAEHDPIRLGELTLDPVSHLVTWRGEPLPLSRLEREVLARLAGPPLVVWTYQRLFTAVWGGSYLGDTSILHSTVKRLRRKLRVVEGTLAIKTVRGVGYRLAVHS